MPGTTISLTHITTATLLLTLRSTTFLTDPIFDPQTTTYPIPTHNITLIKDHPPALPLSALPPIHHILLSHEDHPDNLDHAGRTLLEGRSVLTTPNGAKNLAPRPGVKALKPWEERVIEGPNGDKWKVTGTPCIHTPPGECTGFIIEAADGSFGSSADGRPRAIWISGDTIVFPELVEGLKRWKIVLGIVNLGGAKAPVEGGGEVKITMDGEDAVGLVREVGVERVVPVHFEGWGHFREEVAVMREVLGGIEDRVVWLVPGVEREVEI